MVASVISHGDRLVCFYECSKVGKSESSLSRRRCGRSPYAGDWAGIVERESAFVCRDQYRVATVFEWKHGNLPVLPSSNTRIRPTFVRYPKVRNFIVKRVSVRVQVDR